MCKTKETEEQLNDERRETHLREPKSSFETLKRFGEENGAREAEASVALTP